MYRYLYVIPYPFINRTTQGGLKPRVHLVGDIAPVDNRVPVG